MLLYFQVAVNIIAGGVDYASRQALAFFTPGDNQATALINLLCDSVVENNEEFSLTLSILSPTSGVKVGNRSTATAIIVDSTSKRLICDIT